MGAVKSVANPQPAPVRALAHLDQAGQVALLLQFAPQDQPDPRAWLDLIRTQVMGVSARGEQRPVEDLLYFLHVCRHTQLDPLARQIYAVYRWDSRLGREKMVVQIAIDGMRLVAARSGLYAGQDDARFLPEDESAEHPMKATVTVYRVSPQTGERMPVTASARWAEYAPYNSKNELSGLWGRMPYTMLAKVAEALALRKAFPLECSGLYATEEMEQATIDATPRRLEAPEPAAEPPAGATPAATPPAQPATVSAQPPVAPDATVTAAPAENGRSGPSGAVEPGRAADVAFEAVGPSHGAELKAQAAARAAAQKSGASVTRGAPGAADASDYAHAPRPWTGPQVIAALRDVALTVKPEAKANGLFDAALGLLEGIGVRERQTLFKDAWQVTTSKDLTEAQKIAVVRYVKPAKPEPTAEAPKPHWGSGNPHLADELEAVVAWWASQA